MSLENKLEKTLVEWIKNGDERAFEILFNMYYAPLCDYTITYVKLPDIAEEIVQETFIRIWENRATIQVDVSFKAYMYKSVHNMSINYLKRKKRNRENLEGYLKLTNDNFDPYIFDRLFSKEIENSLKKSLHDLPEKCRNIFILSREEGLTYPQIAEKLNLSLNTIKTQMKKALKRLRETVNENFEK